MKLLTDPQAIVAQIVMSAAGDDSSEAADVSGAAAPEVLTERKKE
jgi:hypothetical protein